MKTIMKDFLKNPFMWTGFSLTLLGMIFFNFPQFGLVKYSLLFFLTSHLIYLPIYIKKKDIITSARSVVNIFCLIAGIINWF